MLRTFAEWRRPGSSCRGGLVWFARDLSPGAGWGVIDSSGRAKAAYWYLKRALAPIALLCADEGLNGLWLHALNDTPDALAGDLRIALYGAGRMRGRPVSVPLDVAPRSSQSVHVDGLFDGFLDLTYAYRFGPPQHDVVSFTLADRKTGALRATACYSPGHLPCTGDPELRLRADVEPFGDGYVLILEANRFAHAIVIDINGFAPDDNYLNLEPARPRQVALNQSVRPPPAAFPTASDRTQRIRAGGHRRHRGGRCWLTLPGSSNVRSRRPSSSVHGAPGVRVAPRAAAPSRRRAGVVLCPPLGYEYMSSYRTYRILADRLAALGFDVIRLDYDGTGNSSGHTEDSGRVPAWLCSIRYAMAETRRLAGSMSCISSASAAAPCWRCRRRSMRPRRRSRAVASVLFRACLRPRAESAGAPER